MFPLLSHINSAVSGAGFIPSLLGCLESDRLFSAVSFPEPSSVPQGLGAELWRFGTSKAPDGEQDIGGKPKSNLFENHLPNLESGSWFPLPAH